MIRRPPRSTRTDTLFPYTTLFRSLVTARARREMSGFERSLHTTATTLNVVQGPLGPIAGRDGALAAAVGELTGLRHALAGTGAALFACTGQATRDTAITPRPVYAFHAQTDGNKAGPDPERH